MADTDYRGALEAAIAEYEALGEERRRVDDRLAQLAQTISTLSRLLGLTPTQPFGLTDACRLVYRNALVPLSPTEVRDRLRAMGVDLSVYSNEMAAVHTVIRRLHESGELKAMATPGRAQYLWQTRPAIHAIAPEAAQFIRDHARFHTDPPAAAARRSRAKKR